MCSVVSSGHADASSSSDHPQRRQLERRRGRRQRHRQRRRRRCGATRLMYAAQQGDVDTVRRIVRSQPIKVLDRDRTGKSSLHYCCTSDNIRAAQAADLLAMAAPDLVDSRDEDGFTPLHLAVIAGNTQLVTFLLANNADVSAVDNEKHTVVHWATVCGESTSLSAVLAAGAPVSTPDVHGGYPLHYAAQMCGGEKDFHLGLQVLQILLSHKDIKVSVEDGDKRQPLLWAASAGSSKALSALVRAGADVESYDKDGLTALHCAASRGHTDCIDTLLTLCGASPDVIDSNGCTALHYAVTLGHADATVLLLSHGADPNRQDRKGRSPAHCGCAKGQFETLKLLASRGANLWLRNARGDLPLHEAASSGRRELVSWLLNMRPSQVNAKNNDGRTPLHMAALNDNTDMCKILIDSGAHINPVLRTTKNIFMTPLDCALQRGFRSTAKFLQLHGGVPASRLGSQSTETLRSSSVVSFPIREDMIFDTSSESADEKVGPEKSISTKTFVRRKPKSKSKVKVAISGSETDGRKSLTEKSKPTKMADQKTQTTSSMEEQIRDVASKTSSTKPLSSKIDYTNEIIINGKTEVTIHQEREITLDQEGNVVSPRVRIDQTITIPARSSSGDREKRPRSAKYSKKSVSRTTEKSEGENDEMVKKISSTTEKSEAENEKMTKKISFEENEAKIDVTPLKSALKQTTKGISSETEKYSVSADIIVGNDGIETSTSEDQDQSKILVEAAVHLEPQQISPRDADISQGTSQEITQIEATKVSETALKPAAEEEKSSSQEKVKDNGTYGEKIDTHAEEKPSSTAKSTNTQEEKQHENVTESSIKDLSADEYLKKSTEFTNQSQIEKKFKDDSVEGEYLPDSSPTKLFDGISENKSHTSLAVEMQKAREIATAIAQKSDKVKHEIILDTQKDKNEEETSKSEEVEVVNVEDKSKETSKLEKSDKHSKESGQNVIFINRRRSKNDEKVKKVDSQEKDVAKTKKDSKILKEKKVLSEDESFVSPSDFSDSIIESSHKSFKVLSEKEAKDLRKNQTKRRSPKSTSLPRSKERRLEAKIKRSKIPTPTFVTALSKSDKQLDKIGIHGDKIEKRIPSLPNIYGVTSEKNHQTYQEINRSAPDLPAAIYSDVEIGTDSDLDEHKGTPTRRKKVKRKSRLRHRESKSAGSDYESSNVIDSGFEPSPRSTRIPKWRNMSERGVVMTSVTRSIQSNIRRYHLERKVFQHLLELKRSQIRADQHNEHVLVKRAIDQYNQSCASTVGAGRYIPKDYTFKSFEKFLYESLRKLQKMDLAYLKGLPANSEHVNPLLCTQSTNRCMHATHAYTGIPCAAYLPKMDHHSIPKIGFTTSSCKPGTGGFLPKIDGKKTVTLELSHGADKQIISLPTDKLDQNKRYYVTFTVKGHDIESSNGDNEKNAHIHPKSD